MLHFLKRFTSKLAGYFGRALRFRFAAPPVGLSACSLLALASRLAPQSYRFNPSRKKNYCKVTVFPRSGCLMEIDWTPILTSLRMGWASLAPTAESLLRRASAFAPRRAPPMPRAKKNCCGISGKTIVFAEKDIIRGEACVADDKCFSWYYYSYVYGNCGAQPASYTRVLSGLPDLFQHWDWRITGRLYSGETKEACPCVD